MHNIRKYTTNTVDEFIFQEFDMSINVMKKKKREVSKVEYYSVMNSVTPLKQIEMNDNHIDG